ncbi:hypothetical protein PYV02_06675 [Leifsonia sp. H3M29-4]|nr:hypothetical protein [Salinibacterium metalliresistens]MDF1478767.1 hypothetical protein [Salinibacterium metalliresistens]
MHELSDGCGVDGLGRGDESDATLLEVGHDDGIIGTVSREAGELVHDDVVDVAVAADAFQHLLERDAFGHLGSGAARLDILGDDGESKLLSFPLARRALSGDRDPLGVVVGVDLSFA